ncbi:MAG TPA: hypothetical protein VJ279_00070, partial [Hanamia sp.]|nr:hypothetical protein [Hanamia sp.]
TLHWAEFDYLKILRWCTYFFCPGRNNQIDFERNYWINLFVERKGRIAFMGHRYTLFGYGNS